MKQVWLADGLPGLCLAEDGLKPDNCPVDENPPVVSAEVNSAEGR